MATQVEIRHAIQELEKSNARIHELADKVTGTNSLIWKLLHLFRLRFEKSRFDKLAYRANRLLDEPNEIGD